MSESSPRRNRRSRITYIFLTPALRASHGTAALEWLDGCDLFQPQDEGELAYSSGVLVEEVAEVLRDLAVDTHAMVEGVVPEQRVPYRYDMLVVFDEPLFAEVGLVDLALGFVLVDEPVVAKGLGVLLSRQPENLSHLRLEPLELTWADLQASDDLQMARDASLTRSARFKSLGEREHCWWSHPVGDQVDEVLRHFAVDGCVVVEGVVPEQGHGRLHGVHLVLDQSLFIGKQFVDFTLCSVLVEEPVAAKRVRVLLLGGAQNLGHLGLESLELTRADLQASDDFQIVHGGRPSPLSLA